MDGFCTDCEAPLNKEEAEFYSTRCERCERLWAIRVEEWRLGQRPEPEFDSQYGLPQEAQS